MLDLNKLTKICILCIMEILPNLIDYIIYEKILIKQI